MSDATATATYKAEKYATKTVYYTGTDTLKDGYALCYDRDHATAVDLVDRVSTTLTLAYESHARFTHVEKPSATNLAHFAGIVAPGAAKTGPGWVKIHVPNGGSLSPFTDQNCTANDTLLSVQPSSYVLGGADDGLVVGQAIQTVNRSSTNGTVQALLHPPQLQTTSVLFAASGRTTVQLPTAAIINNFPVDAMKRDGGFGSFMAADFRRPGDWPNNSFVDATYAASAGGKTRTEHMYPGTGATGELVLFTTTDNQAAEAQWSVPITVSGGNKWAIGARVKKVNITDSKGNFFIGLMLAQKLVGNLIGDTGALADGGALGFQNKEGDGDILDLVYDEGSQTQNEHDDDWATMAADTYITAELYYDGSTITPYLNGVASGSVISAADIAAADFPTAAVLVPTFAAKAAAADDWNANLDWFYAIQP